MRFVTRALTSISLRARHTNPGAGGARTPAHETADVLTAARSPSKRPAVARTTPSEPNILTLQSEAEQPRRQVDSATEIISFAVRTTPSRTPACTPRCPLPRSCSMMRTQVRPRRAAALLAGRPPRVASRHFSSWCEAATSSAATLPSRATAPGHRQPRRCRQRKYRASTKAGVGPLFMSDVLLARCEAVFPPL
jgi:hypothetical protein